MQHERFLYSAQTYRDGKPCGSPMPFDSWTQAEEYLTPSNVNPNWPWPKVVRVKWNERVPADASGIIVEEIRMRYAPGGPLSGTRIYC